VVYCSLGLAPLIYPSHSRHPATFLCPLFHDFIMHFTTSFAAVAALALAPSAMAEVWTLKDTFIGPSFLTGFTHEAIADPTHGRVYVQSASYPITTS
jgi:hypothetical protein